MDTSVTTVPCTNCQSVHTVCLPDDDDRKQFACLDCRKVFILGFESTHQAVEVTFRINFRATEVPGVDKHLSSLLDWWEDGRYTYSEATRGNLSNLMESAIHDCIEKRYRATYGNEMYKVNDSGSTARSYLEAKKEMSSLGWLGIQVTLDSVKAVDHEE